MPFRRSRLQRLSGRRVGRPKQWNPPRRRRRKRRNLREPGIPARAGERNTTSGRRSVFGGIRPTRVLIHLQRPRLAGHHRVVRHSRSNGGSAWPRFGPPWPTHDGAVAAWPSILAVATHSVGHSHGAGEARCHRLAAVMAAMAGSLRGELPAWPAMQVTTVARDQTCGHCPEWPLRSSAMWSGHHEFAHRLLVVEPGPPGRRAGLMVRGCRRRQNHSRKWQEVHS